MARMRALEGQ
jgi:hypothetical protein